MFDWDEFRSYGDGMSAIEHSVLAKCFSHYIAGNDCFEDASCVEMAQALGIFAAGWIASQLLCMPEHKIEVHDHNE